MKSGREQFVNHWDNLGRVLVLLIGGLVWSLALSSCDVATTTVHITAEEFRFSPNSVEVPAHQLVRLIVRNQGRERHVFQSQILTQKIVRFENPSRGQGFDGDAISLAPGEQIEFMMEIPPGVYRFQCRLRGHAGMQGTFIVQGAS